MANRPLQLTLNGQSVGPVDIPDDLPMIDYLHEYKNLTRWTKEIGERPAVKRGRMVNRTSGKPEEQLHERHDASDFGTKTQDKIGARG